MQEQAVCKNCGNHFTGNYCNHCGEKLYSENDKSFRHLADEVFHFFTHLDSKYLKTLKILFTKPGQLSIEYCDGVRKKYFKPISLFLIGIIIYLLIPLSPGLNMSLEGSLTNYKAIGFTLPEKLVQAKMKKRMLSFEQLSEKYHHKSTVIAKPMLFIILPLIACALMLFFYKRRYYYFDHFILSVELSNFFLYLSFIILPFIFAGIAKLLWWVSGKDLYYADYVTGPIVIVALLIYQAIAFYKFYQVPKWQAFLK